ncbi:MAG: hypothetical protein Q9M94_02245 [Candidatus Gracilibacteria bacterium]|nr:hypothetical protein [Candidatus Gracilibacteria bacterium]
MIFLILLSISGFIFIFYINSGNSNYELSTNDNNIENIEEVKKTKNYKKEIIGNDYY